MNTRKDAAADPLEFRRDVPDAGKASPGRRRRRTWRGAGRAHIEVRGVHRAGMARMAGRLARDTTALVGVEWAAVNQATGRLVVGYDEDAIGLATIIEVVENVEKDWDVIEEGFPFDRPEHPGDEEPLRRQRWALAGDALAAATTVFTGALRRNPVSSEVAALVALVDSTPAFRRPLEQRLGPAADLGLAAVHAATQGLAGQPLSLVVDAAYRILLIRELEATRRLWASQEPELHGESGGNTAAPDVSSERAAMPPGAVERYASASSAAGFAAAGGALAALRDPRLAVAATVAGNPKAARLGREAFAATLGHLLAERGVLSMDRDALRRLDRVDTVVLDADALLTGRSVIGSVWVPPERAAEEDDLWLMSRMLFDEVAPRAVQQSDGWWLGPVGSAGVPAAGPVAAAKRALRAPDGTLLCMRDSRGVAAIVRVEPQFEPLARDLAGAAKEAGTMVVTGLHGGPADRLGADQVVAGGSRLTAEVRRLQQEGHVVALVSARRHSALAAADVGIGVLRTGSPTPWGAHVLTSRGLLDAWLLLRAVSVARGVSRRSRTAAAYGAGAASVLALAGPRRGATARAGLAVNSAAAVALAAGAWSAGRLGRQREPVAEECSDWHAMSGEEVLAQLDSRAGGLTETEAWRRFVPEIDDAHEGEVRAVARATIEDLGNPLTPPLAGGAALSAAMGSVTDAGLIGSVMALNAFIGGVQRVGADRALKKLSDATAAHVHVRRGGGDVVTATDRLVVGDVVVLRAGDAVPADCRILEAVGVEVDESSLTGESQTVPKRAEPAAARAVADRHSMLYAGTGMAAGEATAVVVATGAGTEAGRSIREGGNEQARRSGVETRLRRLTSQTVPIALGAGAGVVGAGLLRGRRLSQTLTTGVGLAVAAVPEGLPLVATVAEIASSRRLSARNALVRHHSTIEALGRVDVLCADKTGTLTTGHISVRYVTDGVDDQATDSLNDVGRGVLAAALRASAGATATGHIAHPTDRAVIEAAEAAGATFDLEAQGWHVHTELPFEPSRGYHAVLGSAGDGVRLTVKGAPEIVLPRCTRWRQATGAGRLSAEDRTSLWKHVDRLARSGYRVLAVAERQAKSHRDLNDDRVVRLELIGLLAMADPVRASAADAVAGLRAAGVDVVMVTGDHPITAESIAAELGLLNGKDIVTGPELESLTDDELRDLAGEVAVFARVSPQQKVRIVRAFQNRGRTVAMTGDGANDAAAIRLADVGVAIGTRATPAAKEAADMVVTDDDIETLIHAILEGRAMWASVRDAVAVLVGGNLGEIGFTLASELLVRGGSPLNARQLLLVNLFTDLVPAMALAMRPPASADPSSLASEGPDASLGSALTRDVLVRGAVTAAAGGAGWRAARWTGSTRSRAGTVALVSIVGSQLGQTVAAGWRNPLVVGSSLASAGALAAVVQTPGVSHFFGCRPLGPVGWGIGATASAGSSLAAPLVHRVLDRVRPSPARPELTPPSST